MPHNSNIYQSFYNFERYCYQHHQNIEQCLPALEHKYCLVSSKFIIMISGLTFVSNVCVGQAGFAFQAVLFVGSNLLTFYFSKTLITSLHVFLDCSLAKLLPSLDLLTKDRKYFLVLFNYSLLLSFTAEIVSSKLTTDIR